MGAHTVPEDLRLIKSIPATILPHWSEPPTCTTKAVVFTSVSGHSCLQYTILTLVQMPEVVRLDGLVA